MDSVVGIDLDGVLADFIQGFMREAREMGLSCEHTTTETHRAWDEFPGLSPEEVQRVLARINQSGGFWYTLKPCAPQTVFTYLRELANDLPLYFLTSRGRGKFPKQQTEWWLMKHGILNPTVVMTSLKGEAVRALGVTHYLDDKAGNVVWAKGHVPECEVYLLDRLYNRFDPAVLGSKVKRVASVEQFLKEIPR